MLVTSFQVSSCLPCFQPAVLLFIFRSCVLCLQTSPRSASSVRTLRLSTVSWLAGGTQSDSVPATDGSGLHPTLHLQARFTTNFFLISCTPLELNVCTAISGTVGSSRCCTDWSSWYLASEGTSIKVWSCVVCRVTQHIHGSVPGVQRLRTVLASLVTCSSASLQRD